MNELPAVFYFAQSVEHEVQITGLIIAPTAVQKWTVRENDD
jgi:hypothetical protein